MNRIEHKLTTDDPDYSLLSSLKDTQTYITLPVKLARKSTFLFMNFIVFGSS